MKLPGDLKDSLRAQGLILDKNAENALLQVMAYERLRCLAVLDGAIGECTRDDDPVDALMAVQAIITEVAEANVEFNVII